MTDIPNVLCIKSLGLIENLGTPKFLTKSQVVINAKHNLKKNKIYYLFIAQHPGMVDDKIDDFKIYHIKDFDTQDSKLILHLGSSTVLRKVPPIEDDITFLPLSEFGLQQIQPGCLLNIFK